ncbi:MAG: arsenite methyltransferase [Planctomycetes bacterium]|nr:arsenite methyltransferase [Planctomycetota bacterium]
MTASPKPKAADLRAAVRDHYAARARDVLSGAPTSCCSGPSSCAGGAKDPITRDLYDSIETGGLPPDALAASLGCGNPTALAELRPGERVLDLGSGGGIDVLLSARRVGPEGFAYGLDMTDEMLALAERNRAAAGAENVEFLKGTIEEIPLPDGAVDVIVSNCVVNLSTDKARVLREAFRVLSPGGRFAVSDIVVRGALPPAVRASMAAWAGCVAGALEEREYLRLLREAGFEDAEVRVTRTFGRDDLLEAAGAAAAPAPEDLLAGWDPSRGTLVSAFVRARKPGRA